jgi:hypothetical protein
VGIGLDDLFSGLVGALAVALFTTVYTEIREARQGVRERAGLTRLLILSTRLNATRIRTSCISVIHQQQKGRSKRC